MFRGVSSCDTLKPYSFISDIHYNMENIVECMTAIIKTPLRPDRVSQVIDCSTELDMEASPDLRTC
jgi:hypothetical protein